MMRGGTIVTTLLFSITILKVKVQPKMIVGAMLAVVGVIIVGVSNFIFASGSSS
jgi:drug/metabolite transporter (DMT)-like permease